MNTNTKGDLSVSAFIFKCQKNLIDVATPFGVKRYDLLIFLNNKWNRVQVKTGHIKNGVVRFRTSSIVCRTKYKYIQKSYRDEIEFFGVYVSTIDKTYLIPVDEVSEDWGILRLSDTKNGQKTKIRWAINFEF